MTVVKQIESVRKGSFTSRYLPTYCVFLSTLDLSVNTRIAYKYQVSHFLSWLHHSQMADYGLAEPEARDAVVAQYKVFLKRQRGVKCRTINAALTAIDSFYGFLGLGKSGVQRDRE